MAKRVKKEKTAVLTIKNIAAVDPKSKAVRVDLGVKGREERLWAEVEAPTRELAIMSALDGLAYSLTEGKRESDSDFDVMDKALCKEAEKVTAAESKKQRKKLGLVSVKDRTGSASGRDEVATREGPLQGEVDVRGDDDGSGVS